MLLGKIIVAFATAGIAAIVFISYSFYKTRLSSIAMPCTVWLRLLTSGAEAAR